MRLKLLNILTLCCLLVLCGCGREEEFAIEGKWKNVGEYTFGQAQEGAIIAFDGIKCNLYSPSDTYAFYKDGDSYTLECTSLNFSETMTFHVEVVDADHINLHRGDHVLELQRPGSGSSKTAEKALTEEEKKTKKQALQLVMYKNLADENGTPVYSDSIDIGESDLRGKMVIYNEDDVLFDGTSVERAAIVGEKENLVNIYFTPDGAEEYAKITAVSIGEQIAVISDGKLICAPTIHSEFTGSMCTIEGFTPADAQNVADALNSF